NAGWAVCETQTGNSEARHTAYVAGLALIIVWILGSIVDQPHLFIDRQLVEQLLNTRVVAGRRTGCGRLRRTRAAECTGLSQQQKGAEGTSLSCNHGAMSGSPSTGDCDPEGAQERNSRVYCDSCSEQASAWAGVLIAIASSAIWSAC